MALCSELVSLMCYEHESLVHYVVCCSCVLIVCHRCAMLYMVGTRVCAELCTLKV